MCVGFRTNSILQNSRYATRQIVDMASHGVIASQGRGVPAEGLWDDLK